MGYYDDSKPSEGTRLKRDEMDVHSLAEERFKLIPRPTCLVEYDEAGLPKPKEE